MSAAAGERVRRWQFGEPAADLADALASGAVLAIPTESSYGLAVDPSDAAAVAQLFELKGREARKPLPVVAANVGQIAALGATPDAPGLAWAAERWPAALSILLPLERPLAAAMGEPTVAVRIPDHAGLRALLEALGRPLTATSANPSGAPPYLDPEELAGWLESRGAAAVVVDAGRLPGGAPSTLVEWRDGAPRVLRPGRVEIA